MDPRKSKGGSSSKGRGRGSRSIRPQIQSQPAPYIPQMSPPQYYPQMTSPPYFQPQYFHQPPPLTPTQYTMSPTSDFDPFEYRDGPSRREPSVERDLPLYDLDDDEDDVVPETQQPTPNENDEEIQEVQEVKKKKQQNKAEKKSWTPVEEAALAKAWVHISTCRVVGNEQSRDSFWKRILEHFKQNVKDTTRSFHALNTK